MSQVIVPTIGRQVWYWPNAQQRVDSSNDKSIQPMAATVVYVWGERCVNLQVLNHNGIAFSECSVNLVQPGDPWDQDTGAHCQWMPFQVGQAKAQAQPAS